MKPDIPELDSKELRKFGLIMGAIIAGLFGLLFPWLLNITSPYWPWFIGMVLLIWSAISPNTLKPVYQGWMWFGLLLNKITAPIILGILFYAVIFPIAIIIRLIKYDSMLQKLDKNIDTYRINSKSSSKQSMEKPF